MGTVADKKCPTKKQLKNRANLKRSFAGKMTDQLPRGLVGTKCTASLKIAGIDSNCLLDSGSQVTTVVRDILQAELSRSDNQAPS